MADEADLANECVAQDLERAMRKQRMEAAALAAALQRRSGRCLNCEEDVEPGKRFCDEDCKEDFEKRENAAVRRQ